MKIYQIYSSKSYSIEKIINFLCPFIKVPSLAAYLQLSKLDWGYKTEPSNKSCLGMKNNRCNWPRGKVLGGSSVLNYMLVSLFFLFLSLFPD